MAAAATYTAYPTAAEALNLFTVLGFSLPSGMTSGELDYYRYAAIDELENITGYRPFLAGASATYKFDPPGPNYRGRMLGGGRKLLLSQPFATITALSVGVTATDAGTALTADTDYWKLPANASAKNQPITEIVFSTLQWGIVNSVRITGKPGYSENIPAEVWEAVRRLTASRIAMGLREKLSQSPVEGKLGDESIRFSIELLQKAGETWSSEAKAAIMSYTFMHP